MISSPWTIVLAAGAGKRLATVTGGIPKQYWAPDGRRSLLGLTLDRFAPIATPERTITVVAESHREYVAAVADAERRGAVLAQPADRGTAAGVLFPLASVAAEDPDGLAIVTPSDHGIGDEACFRRGIRLALGSVERRESGVVLFGVEPGAVAPDLGWIVPRNRPVLSTPAFRSIAKFVEKPPVAEACRLFAAGAVWNTMVLVGRVRTLMELFARHLPFHLDVMTTAWGCDPVTRTRFLADWYPALPAADFSRDVITPASSLTLYTWPRAMGWSDLGTPERLGKWLAGAQRVA